MICYMAGSYFPEFRFLLFIGIGISIYGLCYFLVHDVYIHRRFSWFKQLDSPYSKAVLKAHGAHHAKQTKEDCESFGMLLVNPRYFSKRKSYCQLRNWLIQIYFDKTCFMVMPILAGDWTT